jgi:hypothetical protein
MLKVERERERERATRSYTRPLVTAAAATSESSISACSSVVFVRTTVVEMFQKLTDKSASSCRLPTVDPANRTEYSAAVYFWDKTSNFDQFQQSSCEDSIQRRDKNSVIAQVAQDNCAGGQKRAPMLKIVSDSTVWQPNICHVSSPRAATLV